MSRWVRSNGSKLEVREVGPVVLAIDIVPGTNSPLPIIDEILSDDAARKCVKALLATRLYTRST